MLWKPGTELKGNCSASRSWKATVYYASRLAGQSPNHQPWLRVKQRLIYILEAGSTKLIAGYWLHIALLMLRVPRDCQADFLNKFTY